MIMRTNRQLVIGTVVSTILVAGCVPKSKYEALEVLKLKDIVESLEGAIDAFEKVANTVEQIAVKES